MAEEVHPVVFNVQPYQYEPIASESSAGTSDDSSDSSDYDVNEDRIGNMDW